MRRIEAGIRAISSGVRLTFSGCSAGSPFGLGAERVEVGGEVAVGAVGLEQRGRGLDRLQQLFVDFAGGGARFGAGRDDAALATPSGGAEAEAGWALVTPAASMPRSAATVS